jgi:hypothetical protein
MQVNVGRGKTCQADSFKPVIIATYSDCFLERKFEHLEGTLPSERHTVRLS